MLHPTLSYELAQARMADLCHQAQRDTLAGAARRARPRQRGRAVPRWRVLGRRALAQPRAVAPDPQLPRAERPYRTGRVFRRLAAVCMPHLPDSKLGLERKR